MAEVKVTLKPGGRSSYFHVTCSCGWSDSPIPNTDISARSIAEREAEDHRYRHREGKGYYIRGRWIIPDKEEIA